MGSWKGKVPLENKGDWTHGGEIRLRYNPYNSNKSISQKDIKKVSEAYKLAISMLEKSLTGIRRYRKDNNSLAGSTSFSPTYQSILEKNFGKPLDIDNIFKIMNVTRNGLLGLLNKSKDIERIYLFNGESFANKLKLPQNAGMYSPQSVGYVAKYSPASKPKRPIVDSHVRDQNGNLIPGHKIPQARGHLHLRYDGMKEIELARTIIHEGTHLFAGTGDFAYVDDGVKYRNLSAAERLNNADTHAAFCEDIFNSS